IIDAFQGGIRRLGGNFELTLGGKGSEAVFMFKSGAEVVQKVIREKRLGHEAEGAGSEAAVAVVILAHTSEHDNGDLAGDGVMGEAAADFVAIEVGEHAVEDD